VQEGVLGVHDLLEGAAAGEAQVGAPAQLTEEEQQSRLHQLILHRAGC
jgi:hypothetical protein